MGNEVVAAKPKPTKMAPRRGKAGRGPKPKMTKEERRTKYTDIAKKRRQKLNGRGGGGSLRFGDGTAVQPVSKESFFLENLFFAPGQKMKKVVEKEKIFCR